MFKNLIESDPDPEKLIYHWTKNFNIPQWRSKDAYLDCRNCGESFKKGHQHNCRLCGEMFCSNCTQKFWLPPQFKLKSKKGPDRVCLDCRDVCLTEKKRSGGDRQKSGGLRIINNVIYPPEWDDADAFSECSKCKKKGGKGHNCRICGIVFCGKCTTKTDVPDVFQRKQKTGPARVCDACRYLVVEGTPLAKTKDPPEGEVEESSPAVQPSSAPASKPPEPGSSFQARLQSQLADGEPHSEGQEGEGREFLGMPRKSGFPRKTAVKEAAVLPSGAAMHIFIKWENADHTLADLQVTDTTSLKAIDAQFKRHSYPLGERFSYLCREIPVPDAFWDIFTAQHIAPILYLRREIISQSAGGETSGASDLGSGLGSAPIDTKLNPYSSIHRRDPDEERKLLAAKAAEKEAAASAASKPGWKKPIIKKPVEITPSVVVSSKPKPSQDGESGAPAKVDGEDPFAARAKAFGGGVSS